MCSLYIAYFLTTQVKATRHSKSFNVPPSCHFLSPTTLSNTSHPLGAPPMAPHSCLLPFCYIDYALNLHYYQRNYGHFKYLYAWNCYDLLQSSRASLVLANHTKCVILLFMSECCPTCHHTFNIFHLMRDIAQNTRFLHYFSTCVPLLKTSFLSVT